MDERHHIEQLTKELKELDKQLHEYRSKVLDLQRRIAQIDNKGHKQGDAGIETTHIRKLSLENFIGLRLIHFAGIIVLVIGLSIGVKYAIDKNLISEGMRIALAYSAGFVLYGLSVWLKKNYKSFSAILFSGAMASLYFTTYGAFVYYHIFSFGVAFAFMILLTFYTVYEAIRYSREEIALLGLVGAYAIPFLISQNNDKAELFFFYIATINVAVVFLAIKKSWKKVGRVAQIITWLLFLGWAAIRFNIRVQWVGFFFMVLFYFLFLLNAFSAKLFHKHKLLVTDSYMVLFNNIALYLAALFVFGYSFVDAQISIITFSISIFTGLQAAAFHFFWQDENFLKKLVAAFSLLLLIVFIAFNWDGVVVTLLWLLTAVCIFSVGVYRKSVPLRMTAILLIGVTLLKLVLLDSLNFSPVQKIISYLVLGVLLLIVSFFYQKFRKQLFGE